MGHCAIWASLFDFPPQEYMLSVENGREITRSELESLKAEKARLERELRKSVDPKPKTREDFSTAEAQDLPPR